MGELGEQQIFQTLCFERINIRDKQRYSMKEQKSTEAERELMKMF